MQIPATIESFQFGNEEVHAYIPAYQWIQEQYQRKNCNAPFPYWAKVWPAAKALCVMIAAAPTLVKDKQVLELAAGLGLPSLLAARFATKVTASDYIQDAVEMMRRSADYNQFTNMQCDSLDWNSIDPQQKADVLLLSDINYDPNQFNALYLVLTRFIEDGSMILLSTPQRLAGRSFLLKLMPWCRQQQELLIDENGEMTAISVWILKR